MGVYLDYNASAPIDSRVLDVMIDVYKNVIGNPDSRTHVFGDNARGVVEKARKQVAELLAVDSTEVFFTSGATESNNIAIQGLKEYALLNGKRHIITTAIEHKAVLETVKFMETQGFEVSVVSPDLSGRVTAEQILNEIRDDTFLVSIMHVNNETGIIQPVNEIGKALKNTSIFFHVDATQSCGKLVDEIRTLNYDMLSFSAHKLGGPQGVGGLVLKRIGGRRLPVKNLYFGGQQENGIRPGTVPVALVAGCGEACAIASAEYQANEVKNATIKQAILKVLNDSNIKYQLIGDQCHCVSSTLNVALLGIVSEALMLSTKDYCAVSNGSACTSKSYSPSYVLKAMGIPEDVIMSAIRISWGPTLSAELVTEEFKELLEIAKQMI